MSEEGIDDVIDRGLRQLLAGASQIAERVARLRQEMLHRQQQATDRAQQEYLRELAADRANMRAVLAPVNEAEWWNRASAEQVAGVYQAAEAWKEYDPAALEASERIRDEVRNRYGIDTADVRGDHAYLQDAVDTQQGTAARMDELRKHNEAMALIATAQAAELQREAHNLRSEMERLQVPEQYLADPALLEALRDARDAPNVDARSDAESVVAERLHLIQEDGLQGPNLEALREEIASNYSGVDESLFQDAAFIAAARDWHDARVLAEGGFTGRDKRLEARYEASEKELFSRIGDLGRDIEKTVFGDQRVPATSAEGQQAKGPAYGSAAHRAALGKKIEGTGTNEEINGRLVAAADQGTHPREATRQDTKVSVGSRRKPVRTSVRDRSKGGPSR